MKRILSVIALASLASISWAQSLNVSGSGTFGPTGPTTFESAPGDTWNFSFDVNASPAVTNAYPGCCFDTTFSDFSYYLNGTKVTTSPTELTWFSTFDSGLFDLSFADGGVGPFGSQAYSGSESNPTILTGAYPVSDGFFYDNLHHGTLSGTINISVPEGSAPLLYLLLAGASCCGAILLRSRNRFRTRKTV
jgi:hypothetical protein